MEAKLVIVSPEIQPSEYRLKLPTMIGRSREAHLKLVHPLVSRRHCEIYEDDGRLMVRDFSSLNGTFVGQRRVEDVAALPPGALLTIGTITFRAEYESLVKQVAALPATGVGDDTDFEILDDADLAPPEAAIDDAGLVEVQSKLEAVAPPADDATIDLAWLSEPDQVTQPAPPSKPAIEQAAEPAEVELVPDEEPLPLDTDFKISESVGIEEVAETTLLEEPSETGVEVVDIDDVPLEFVVDEEEKEVKSTESDPLAWLTNPDDESGDKSAEKKSTGEDDDLNKFFKGLQ